LLCIAQDDEQDWEKEEAKMAGMFGGYLLAIPASRTASCNEGFLQSEQERNQLVLSGEYQGSQLIVYARNRAVTDPLGVVCQPLSTSGCF
jgi:hypothetical protein